MTEDVRSRSDLTLRSDVGPLLGVDSQLDFGAFSFSREEIVAFAREWDPLPMHADERWAVESGPFGGLIASGMLTLGRELTTHFSAVYPIIAGTGVDYLRLAAPVRPDVPFSAVLTVESVAPRGQQKWPAGDR